MNSSDVFHRLTIRFTNGESAKFLLHEPVDPGRISEKSRFAIVRVVERESDIPSEVFVASLDDVSYIKSARIEQKDLRHRVAGITGAMVDDGEAGPDAIATIEFI